MGLFGPLWNVYKPAMFGHFGSYLGHEWQVMGPKQVFYLYLVPDDLVKVS